MYLQINGLSISNLQKASEDLVRVDIIANHLTEDQEGETVLKEAFSPDSVKEFLDIGVIEYWHESRNPNLSKAERNENLIGNPVSFRWDNGKPIVTADLTKKHPIVEKMLPHLSAGLPVYAASIGGKKVVLEVSDPSGQKHKVIPQIKWDHLAIAPRNAVINREGGVNVRMLQKANDIFVEFDNADSFACQVPNLYEQEETLIKALAAPGSSSDLYTTPGGVITKQSLEGSPVSFSEPEVNELINTIIGVNAGYIPTQKAAYDKYFEQNGKKEMGDKIYGLFQKYFKKRS